jgi:hypothetical protein
MQENNYFLFVKQNSELSSSKNSNIEAQRVCNILLDITFYASFIGVT